MPIAVVPVPASRVAEFWPTISKLIQPAIDRSGGRCTAGQILDLAQGDKATVWLMVDRETKKIEAAAVSEMRSYPTTPRLHVMLVGGTRMNEWLSDIVAQLKAFGKHNGAKQIEVYGRTGWERELKKVGFVKRRVCLMEAEIV